MHWWGYGWGWGGMIFGFFMMLVFWGVLIALVVFAIRALSGSSSRTLGEPSGTSRALDILKERYARGEITKEQYEEMREHLKKT